MTNRSYFVLFFWSIFQFKVTIFVNFICIFVKSFDQSFKNCLILFTVKESETQKNSCKILKTLSVRIWTLNIKFCTHYQFCNWQSSFSKFMKFHMKYFCLQIVHKASKIIKPCKTISFLRNKHALFDVKIYLSWPEPFFPKK